MPQVFCYGALMAQPHVLEHGRHAVLPGYSARFVLRGIPFVEPRFLALVEDADAEAHGVLFSIDDAGWEEMSRHEMTYERRLVRVQAGDEEVEAIALVAPRWVLRTERPPSARYARLLVVGGQAHGLPDELVARWRGYAETGPKLSIHLAGLRYPVVWLARYIGTPAAALIVLLTITGLAAGCVRLLLG